MHCIIRLALKDVRFDVFTIRMCTIIELNIILINDIEKKTTLFQLIIEEGGENGC